MLSSMRAFKARIFKALAHPIRVAIVEYAAYGERSEESLRDKVGVDAAEFAQHAAVLVRCGILQKRQAGDETFYRLCDPAFGKVLEAMREYFIEHLNEALAAMRAERELGGDDADSASPA